MAPMQVSLRSAMGVLKDQTSISLAKVASAGVPDLDVAIVKATSHDDAPLVEKYVQDVLHLTSYSRSYVSACVHGIAKRLSKTRDWIVALKALMLAHRLLRDGDSAFEQELTLSGRRGMRVLNASDFRDKAHSNGWDFSAFIHAYGLYLDERLNCTLIGSFASRPKQEPRSSCNESRYNYGDIGVYNDNYDSEYQRRIAQEQSKSVKDMKPEELLESFLILQRVLDRVLDCRPTGMAKVSRLVNIALYLVVRESFLLYTDICDGLAILLDAFFDMESRESGKVFAIYSRAAKQIEDLISFYSFCKALGICRTTEYPIVEKISEEMLETLEDCLRNRSDADQGFRRPRSSDPKASSPQHERRDEAVYVINGMKALPALPLPADEPATAVPAAKPNPLSVNTSNGIDGDPLLIDEPALSTEGHENKVALALFSGSEISKWESFSVDGNQGTAPLSVSGAQATPSSNNGADGENQLAVALYSGSETGKWESFSADGNQGTAPLSVSGARAMPSSDYDAAGWELALLKMESDLSKPSGNTLAGGFNNLVLDNLYEQGAVHQKMLSASASSGSASSVAMLGQPQSNFLALPAFPAAATALPEDPFAASLNVSPPVYVQMSELRQNQQLLVQEQQQWIQYQQAMIQGHLGMMKFPHNPYAASASASFQPVAYPISYYGMNPYFP